MYFLAASLYNFCIRVNLREVYHLGVSLPWVWLGGLNSHLHFITIKKRKLVLQFVFAFLCSCHPKHSLSHRRHAHRPPTVRSLTVWCILDTNLESTLTIWQAIIWLAGLVQFRAHRFFFTQSAYKQSASTFEDLPKFARLVSNLQY